MARGKAKKKSKRSILSRFVDILTCCCGRSRGRGKLRNNIDANWDSTGVNYGFEEIDVLEGEGNVKAENQLVKFTVLRDEEPQYVSGILGNLSVRKENTPTIVCMDLIPVNRCARNRDFNDIDGQIDLTDRLVPQWLQNYRSEILQTLNDRIQVFKYRAQVQLKLLKNNPGLNVNVREEESNGATAVEVSAKDLSFMFHVTQQREIRTTAAVWDTVVGAWYLQTYADTYNGPLLIFEGYRD